MSRRVFLFVLDSLGAGESPDAIDFGDLGAHTLRTLERSGGLHIPNLQRLGIGNIDGLAFLGRTDSPMASVARLREASAGKDTTIGHWELAGLISRTPLPTYPDGFPDAVLDPLKQKTGRGILCNKPYSGTEVIKDYGAAHLKSGDLIVYTSADSVFQIAAHEELVPPKELYEICTTAREILSGEHGVGRVIARPFTGKEGSFTRTANRRDFSLQPPGRTLLDAVSEAGLDSIAVGKINDIFAGRGITQSVYTHSNKEGMDRAAAYAAGRFSGLCFVNLVDFDMLYGHRNDIEGYTAALNAFDAFLGEFLSAMGEEDLLVITADHGCDPGYPTTDHTREYVPLLLYGRSLPAHNFGTRPTFADVAATVAAYLGVNFFTPGEDLYRKGRIYD